MTKRRKQYTAQEKVAILKRHLVDNTPVSDLCDEHDLHPNVFYRWQRQFFEGGAAAFAQESSSEFGRLKRKVAALEERLARKDTVLAEITEEYVRCKKNDGVL
jgi:transposase-like protein